jgi:DNA-binding transcriptional ArsR family regulator
LSENPSYYAIIPAEVRYDKRLRANEKLMYGEITCLTQKEGYCYASNNYFASLYDVTPQAVSQWVSNLEKAGYIKLEYVYNGKEIKERRMRLVSTKVEEGINKTLGVSTKVEEGINKTLIGYQQKFKENNTSINNINLNNTSNVCADSFSENQNKNNATGFENYNWGDLQQELWSLLKDHNENSCHRKIILDSKSDISFYQKECRQLIENWRAESPYNIRMAFFNFLDVIDMDNKTWWKATTFNTFIKNYRRFDEDNYNATDFLENKGGKA